MLKQWLQAADTMASWRKLFAVIESTAVSSAPDKDSYLIMYKLKYQ